MLGQPQEARLRQPSGNMKTTAHNGKRVAIIGGGINGLCTAWALSREGHPVELFERAELVGQTSRASTKLLHGGLRYLENGEFRLVREALRERQWWLATVPALTRPLQLLLPVYRTGSRSRWKLKLGLSLYDRLAGAGNLGRHQWHDVQTLATMAPDLKPRGLLGAFTFYDGQMDDYRLGLWVAEQTQKAGARLHCREEVLGIGTDGGVTTPHRTDYFDVVVNAAGPWAEQLLQRSGIQPRHHLDLIRGSHLLVERQTSCGYLLEAPQDHRPFFVLPYQGKTLLGTTEERQTLGDGVHCTDEECCYLTEAYNTYFRRPLRSPEIVGRFAGIRPLIRSASNPQKATREYAVERHGRVVTVFGGKWTTARALGERVAAEVVEILKEGRPAQPAARTR